MTQPSLAIFSNFFIDNDERLQRMIDSFFSFRNINPKEWVINIRGSLKYKAGNFLKKELGEDLNLFYLQSKQGWMHDSLMVSKKINSDYVFYWSEDHILIMCVNNTIGDYDFLKKSKILLNFTKINKDTIFPKENEAFIYMGKLHIFHINKATNRLTLNK